MSNPVTLPAKLCKDCRFFIPDGALCGHDSAISIDYINGNHKRYRASMQRGCLGSNDCGHTAKFFEPTDSIIPINPPADVIPLVLHRGDVA